MDTETWCDSMCNSVSSCLGDNQQILEGLLIGGFEMIDTHRVISDDKTARSKVHEMVYWLELKAHRDRKSIRRRANCLTFYEARKGVFISKAEI